ncbi:hypothetical protein FXV83_24960 [Bradyrhizobium hipponense]|uniref:Uncharacterized protein n=1 Tax=Bradyrhizobium hipponense TaxID=2605638 RepID=A0A5S4YJU3_9BRAD|nr:hypothetical protein [Bradyrhizobium hipponense]TYO63884.1 hypothetical protein FXV83_24960 [Bradyrhizobium hipponense]
MEGLLVGGRLDLDSRPLVDHRKLQLEVDQLFGATEHGDSQSFIAKYEGGERRIDLVEFVGIAPALSADPVKLLRDFLSGKAVRKRTVLA